MSLRTTDDTIELNRKVKLC